MRVRSRGLLLAVASSWTWTLTTASIDGAVFARSGAPFLRNINFTTDSSHLLQIRQSSNCSLPAPNVICASGDACCPASDPLCCPNFSCCPTNTNCISGQNQLCCPTVAETCGRPDFCLGKGQTCCGKIAGGSGYCNAGYECLTASNGDQACCLPGNIACSSTLCCPSGTQCSTTGIGCAAAAPQTNGTSNSSATSQNVSGGTSNGGSGKSLSTGAIAGIAVGGALALALIAIAGCLWLRRHRKKVYQPTPYDPSAQMYQTGPGPTYPQSPSTGTYVPTPLTAGGASYAHSTAPTATSYPHSPPGGDDALCYQPTHEYYQVKPPTHQPQEMDGNRGTYELDGSGVSGRT